MELREYITIIWRWMWLIVLGTVLAGGTALVVSMVMTPVYEARAGVAVVRTSFQLELEPRFKTLSEEEVARLGADRLVAENRRDALTAMVPNMAVAAQVYDELKDDLPTGVDEPADLIDLVDSEVDGDIIQIKVRYRDPQFATQLANAWARSYERHVNSIYSGQPAPANIQQQATQSKQTYEAAEARLVAFMRDNQIQDLTRGLEEKQGLLAKLEYFVAESKLVAFIRENQIDELNRQAQEKQAVLTKLQEGRQTAVTTLIDEELQAEQQLISEYLRRWFQNRLITFQKEQDAKSQLLTSFLDAAIAERQKVFDEQLEANLARLSEAYARRHKVDQLLVDARAFEERLQNPVNSNSGVASNALTFLLLQTSAFTQSADPITSQLDLRVHIDELTTISSGRQGLSQDVDSLISLLESKRTEYDQDIQTLSRSLLNSENLDYLVEDPLAGGALMKAIETKYADLFELGDLADLADTVGTDNPLVKAVEERAQNLLKLQGLQQMLSFSTLDEPATQAIRALEKEVDTLQADLELEKDRQRELSQARDLAWEDYAQMVDHAERVELETAPASRELSDIRQSIAGLRDEIAGLQADMELLRAQEQELKRAREMALQSYTVLTNKAEEINIAASTAEGTEVRFAMTATVPRRPVEPRTMLNTLLASVVGAMLALGVAFLLAFMDDSLRWPSDVGQVLELPTLGVVPRGATINDDRPVTIPQPAAPVAEAMRMLRTGLRTLEHRPNSLLITSAGPHEGKTSVAANLAVVMAQAGRSVVVVDTDLRHPALHELFGVSNAAGLTTLLNSDHETPKPFTAAMLNASLQPTGVSGLRVLPAGPDTERPADLLESPQMQELLTQLRELADMIVLDSPPAGMVADAAVLAPQVDGTLLVVATGATPAGQVQAVRDMLEAVGGHVLGVVLNNMPAGVRLLGANADGTSISLFGFSVPLPSPLVRGLERLLMLF